MKTKTDGKQDTIVALELLQHAKDNGRGFKNVVVLSDDGQSKTMKKVERTVEDFLPEARIKNLSRPRVV